MNNCALVNADTGEIRSLFYPADPDHFEEGSSHGGLVVRWDTSGTIQGHGGHFINDYYHDGESFVKKETKPEGVYKFDWTIKSWVFNEEEFFRTARQTRDGFLAQSDWSQLSDSPLSESDKYKWMEYRQALRDIIQTLDGIHSLDEINWPQRP